MGGRAIHFELPTVLLKNASASSPSSPSSPASSTSSCVNLLVSAGNSGTFQTPRATSYCSSPGEIYRSIEERNENRVRESPIYLILSYVPSPSEVEKAMAALQNFLQGIGSYGSALNWLQQMSDGRGDSETIQSHGYRRIHDAHQLLQTDPSFKKLVVSLCSDKVVWDAVVNNELVGKFRDLPSHPGGNRRSDDNHEEANLGTQLWRWILNITIAKVLELMGIFFSLVNDVFNSPDKERLVSEKKDDLNEKIRSSLVLTVVILLIVVVARVKGA